VSATKSKNCIKCKKGISDTDLYKIVMYIVDQKFSDHHYEHVECPGRFSV